MSRLKFPKMRVQPKHLRTRCVKCSSFLVKNGDYVEWCWRCNAAALDAALKVSQEKLHEALKDLTLLSYRLTGIRQAWLNLEQTKLPESEKTFGEVFASLAFSPASSLHEDGLQAKLASRTINDLI